MFFLRLINTRSKLHYCTPFDYVKTYSYIYIELYTITQDHIWEHLILCEDFWYYHIWLQLIPSDQIWFHQITTSHNRSHLRGSHQITSGHIWTHKMVTSDHIRSQVLTADHSMDHKTEILFQPLLKTLQGYCSIQDLHEPSFHGLRL